MSNTPNFQAILDEAPTEVERPKARPVGTYLCVVGQATYEKSSKKGTPFVKFPLRALTALDDVDSAELEESGGIDGFNTSVTFYLTEDAIYRLDEFHEHCGLDLADPLSRRGRNELVANAQVLVVIGHREQTLTNEERAAGVEPQVYAEVKRTAPAE